MVEYMKEITIAATIAIAAALGVGILAITALPNGPSTVTVTVTYTNFATPTNTTIATSALSHTIVGLPGAPSTQDVSCSLATGVCNLTVLNNSTSTLELEACRMTLIVSSNVSSGATTTAYSSVNGTIGGPATAGVPPNSQSAATCTVPATQLGHETKGFVADGTFTAKLVDSTNPAGTETTVGFEGAWS